MSSEFWTLHSQLVCCRCPRGFLQFPATFDDYCQSCGHLHRSEGPRWQQVSGPFLPFFTLMTSMIHPIMMNGFLITIPNNKIIYDQIEYILKLPLSAHLKLIKEERFLFVQNRSLKATCIICPLPQNQRSLVARCLCPLPQRPQLLIHGPQRGRLK